jgi:hypothetical protein
VEQHSSYRGRVELDFAVELTEQYNAGQISKAEFIELIIQHTSRRFAHALTEQQRADCEDFIRTSLTDPLDPCLSLLLGNL